MGWKMVYNFLGKDEKTEKSLLLLKTSMWKRRRIFFHTVNPNKNHVNTHPASGLKEYEMYVLFSGIY